MEKRIKTICYIFATESTGVPKPYHAEGRVLLHRDSGVIVKRDFIADEKSNSALEKTIRKQIKKYREEL